MDTTPPLHIPRRVYVAGGLILLTALAGAATRARPVARPPLPSVPAAKPVVASTNGPVSLAALVDRTAVRVGGDGQVRVELTLAGAQRDGVAPVRHASDLLIVLDRSGSMDGDKIVNARAAIRELVDQLDGQDRFALIAYSDDARLEIPLTAVSAAARAQWLATVDRLGPAGGTNMSSGLDLALETLARAHAAGASPRVILISDGLANQGDSSEEGLVARARRAARAELTLTTVGVGDDFNEGLMTALADAGTGNYYYVQHASDLGAVFAREFGAARTTVASAVAVEITPASGVRVLDAAGYPLETVGQQVVFRPGTLFSGQERRIWVTLTVPNDQPIERALGEFAVTYKDGEVAGRVALAELPRVACVANDDDFFAKIDVPTWERAVGVDGFNQMQDEVAKQVKSGNRDAARTVLRKFRAETTAMNDRLESPAVQQKLDAVQELEAHVDDAFQGADQKGKQNTLSKSRGAAAYDARRAGSKY